MKYKTLGGIPGWCVILEMRAGLVAMVTLDAEEPIRFASDPLTFTKHGYFADAADVPEKDAQAASNRLDAINLRDAERLWDEGSIAIHGSRKERLTLLEALKEVAKS